MLRNEDLIVLAERIWLTKEIFVEGHACLCHIEHFLVVDITHEGLSCIDSHQRESIFLTLMVAERTSYDRIKVGGNAIRFTENNLFLVLRNCDSLLLKDFRCSTTLRLQSGQSFFLLLLNFSFICDDSPVAFCLALETPYRLKIRLIKAWEDIMAVISFKLGVDVLLLIHFVSERVQAHTILSILVQEEDLSFVCFANTEHT